MDTTAPGVSFAFGLSLLLAAGYVWGSALNRRIRRSTIRWAREGFRGLADDAAIRTFGTSGVMIRQARPRPGVTDLQITTLLLPREVLPLWLWHRIAGRRDLVVVRVTLPTPARADLEIVARASVFGRAAMRGLTEAEGWRIVDRGESFTIAARRTKDAGGLARRLLETLRPVVPDLAQVSVRRGTPAVQVGFPLPPETSRIGPMLDGLAAAARHLVEER